MQQLISRLKQDFPKLQFAAGATYYWSPQTRQVFYSKIEKGGEVDRWSLLHEVGHALLDHQVYQSDFELLLMESEAWHQAVQLGSRYDVKIDNDHIQDCLDTYRDWLHARSRCPACDNQSLQASPTTYGCFNCGTKWRVSPARFCRPYRLTIKHNKTA